VWNLSGDIDYASKVCLACPPTGTQTAAEAVNSLEQAIHTAEELLEMPLADDCRDENTGELAPLVIVSDDDRLTRVVTRGLFAHSTPISEVWPPPFEIPTAGTAVSERRMWLAP
jgi:hypothetical protein